MRLGRAGDRWVRRGATTALLALPFLLGGAAAPGSEQGREVCRVEDERIVEASGLAVTGPPPPGGALVTVNDSGDEGRVFVLDPVTCETVGVTRWAEEPEDVEALAPARAADGTWGVWVGDIGDNPSSRDTVRVGLVPVGAGDREVSPQWTDLRYPDGPRDAEALLRHPGTGRLYVVSKRVVGGAVYEVPQRVAPGAVGSMRRLGGVLSLVTDGAFWPDGRHVLLRNYGRAAVYTWPGLAELDSFSLPPQEQGEALAVAPDGRVLVASEGRDQPVLEVALPQEVREAVEGGDSSGPSAGTDGVPGEQAGPATTDEEDGVGWPGLVLGTIGLAVLLVVGARLGRSPGAGSGG